MTLSLKRYVDVLRNLEKRTPADDELIHLVDDWARVIGYMGNMNNEERDAFGMERKIWQQLNNL